MFTKKSSRYLALVPSITMIWGPSPPPPGPRWARALLAPPPPGGGIIGMPPGPPGPPGLAPPKPNDLFSRRLAVHCEAPRALLRSTPAGRSLNTVSPLSSRPVVTV